MLFLHLQLYPMLEMEKLCKGKVGDLGVMADMNGKAIASQPVAGSVASSPVSSAPAKNQIPE